jgi:hypothetical protein
MSEEWFPNSVKLKCVSVDYKDDTLLVIVALVERTMTSVVNSWASLTATSASPRIFADGIFF